MSFTPSSGQESIALRKNDQFEKSEQKKHFSDVNLKAFNPLNETEEEKSLEI
jgi:hypothetical protein